MGWKEIDERLIRRGELLLEVSFLENHQEELEAMNQGKAGRPFRLARSYIQLLSTVRYLYSMPYRQLEGFTRALNRLVHLITSADYSGLRRRILALSPDLYAALKEDDRPVALAVDSIGVKVHRAGGWVERKHGKRKRYVKLHFAVDVESKEVVAMEVSTDDTHDVKAFLRLVEKAEKRRHVSQALGDGAYDSADVFEELEARGVEPIIKPRRSSRLDTPSQTRRNAVRQYKGLGHQAWARLKSYGARANAPIIARTALRASRAMIIPAAMSAALPSELKRPSRALESRPFDREVGYEPVIIRREAEKREVILQIVGLHCASFVASIEKALNSLDGVESAGVNLATEKARVSRANMAH